MAMSSLDIPQLPAQDASRVWADAFYEAYADPRRTTGFLALAEEAVRACPGAPEILYLAATAALFDEHPERALVFLKRLSKRYVSSPTLHLLHALALAQQNKLAPARALLERHGMSRVPIAMRSFPGGPARGKWLADRLAVVFGRASLVQRHRTTPRVARKESKPTFKVRAVEPLHEALAVPPTPGPDGPVIAAPLPKIDVDIPFTLEFDRAALSAALRQVPDPRGGAYLLREQLAHFSLAQGFDELLCLSHLRGIQTLWHQVETVRKVLKQFRGRVLLADEVGLGKTVEAGMVLKEYLLRGMVERVLILVPASLVGQWREELETKFDIPCLTTHDPLLRDDPDRFWRQPRLIASLAAARRREHAERLSNHSFDLVIVDEAHHLCDRTSRGYQLLDALNKRFLLLLSATPVQNDLTELYNVLTLLKPGIFKTLKEFRAAYVMPGKPRLPANPERLRELMRSAMIRNTRAVVALRLPRRHAATVRVEASAAEQHAYRDLAALARGLAAAGGHGRHRLALHHLLGAAGSSPAAAAAALARFADRRGEGESAWRALAERWTSLGKGAKEAALFDLLRRNPAEKKIVFVRYRETMAHLADLLDDAGIRFARFEGTLSGPDKDAAIAAFRDEVPVLISTESGGEGRNLQFCNTLVNFDVPWNPMAIEQRIGRIDRIGQQREVFVFNLVTRGTVEEQVLHILEEKISMFELVVGEIGAILGGAEEERDFADLILDAWLEASESARAEAFESIGSRLDQARRRHEEAKALDEALFGEDFETS